MKKCPHCLNGHEVYWSWSGGPESLGPCQYCGGNGMIEPDEDRCLCCGEEIIINEDGDDWCICIDNLCDNCNGEVRF